MLEQSLFAVVDSCKNLNQNDNVNWFSKQLQMCKCELKLLQNLSLEDVTFQIVEVVLDLLEEVGAVVCVDQLGLVYHRKRVPTAKFRNRLRCLLQVVV